MFASADFSHCRDVWIRGGSVLLDSSDGRNVWFGGGSVLLGCSDWRIVCLVVVSSMAECSRTEVWNYGDHWKSVSRVGYLSGAGLPTVGIPERAPGPRSFSEDSSIWSKDDRPGRLDFNAPLSWRRST